MRFIQVLLSASLAFAFSGCKSIEIKDGRIPNQYLSHARKLEGVYKGNFNGIAGELSIRFSGNKPVVVYQNSRGTDLLNNNCDSEFGDLRRVLVKNENKNPEVRNATFDFDPGRCSMMVEGRNISVNFKETSRGMRANVTLLKEIEHRQVCSWTPGNGQRPPTQMCHWEALPVYLYGQFFRAPTQSQEFVP